MCRKQKQVSAIDTSKLLPLILTVIILQICENLRAPDLRKSAGNKLNYFRKKITMEISPELLDDIVQNMETGLVNYLHKDHLELIAVPDEDEYSEAEMEPWKEDLQKIKKEKSKFIRIEAMSSGDAFRVMEAFTDAIDNRSVKIRLLKALDGKKPFAHFKMDVEQLPGYRDNWFTFKREKNMEWVTEQLTRLS